MNKTYLSLVVSACVILCVIGVYAGNVSSHADHPSVNRVSVDGVGKSMSGGVESFLERRYPECKILDKDTDNGLVEVKLRHDGKEKVALFGSDGTWIRTLWNVRRESLPQWVMDVMKRDGFAYADIDDNDNQAVDTRRGVCYAVQARRNNSNDMIYVVSRRGISACYTGDEWADGRHFGHGYGLGRRHDGRRHDGHYGGRRHNHRYDCYRNNDNLDDRIDENGGEWYCHRHGCHRRNHDYDCSKDCCRHDCHRHYDNAEDRFDEGDDE